MKGLLIAGGGTGGHIYPAIAIAQAVKKNHPDMAIDFVGTNKGLETKIVPRENFPLHFVNIGALNNVGFLTKVLTLLALPLAVFQGVLLILKLRPKVILGVGGYASGPVMVAGLLLKPFLKHKLTLFEANAFPGMTNRWVSKFADVAFTNFEETNHYFKRPLTVGIPIRSGLAPASKESHSTFRVLVFGGSQGARGINVTVSEAVKQGGAWLENIEIVHQIGSTDFKKFDEFYKTLNPSNVRWFEFLYDMPERYKWADLIVCRAGASTLAELSACQKAAILIPFPFASDNHQQENAEAIASKKGALMILQKDFTASRMIDEVTRFKNQKESLKTFEKEIAQFYRPQSAERVAESLLGGHS